MDISNIYIPSAFLLGMLHTFEPGHGKSVISAYLIGTKGRIRDALVLGAVTAFAHTFSVILLGAIMKVVSEEAFTGVVQKSFQITASALIILVGLWIIYAASTGRYHSHNHAHSHDHPHEGDDHIHVGETALRRYRFPQLLAIGFSAGMIPCPAGIAVLLSAVSSNQMSRGLILIVIFSLGVAFTITTIAVIAANVGQFASLLIGNKGHHFFEKVPFLSGTIILIIGIYDMIKLLI